MTINRILLSGKVIINLFSELIRFSAIHVRLDRKHCDKPCKEAGLSEYEEAIEELFDFLKESKFGQNHLKHIEGAREQALQELEKTADELLSPSKSANLDTEATAKSVEKVVNR